MPTIVLLIVLIVVVVLLAKSFHAAQQEQSTAPTRRPRAGAGPRQPRPRARPRRLKPVDQAKLAEHVKKLREAVDAELISTEEAVASIVRHSEGQLSKEAAAQLLRSHDAA